MFTDKPVVTTRIQAIDELDEVRHSLAGLSTLLLAMQVADICDAEALSLSSRLLDYCALVLDSATDQLEPVPLI